MIINVAAILKNDESGLDIDFEEKLEDLVDFSDEYELDKLVSFKGRLENTKRILHLKGTLATTYLMQCSRCLARTEDSLKIVIQEDIVSDSDDKEEYTYDTNVVDLSKILTDNIILNLPLVKLCSADCKGLCYTCGKNLNDGKCNCSSTSTDPRLDVLKNFLE